MVFVDRISRHNQSLRIPSLLFADDVSLLATLVDDLCCSLERFAAEGEVDGMRTSPLKFEAMVLCHSSEYRSYWVGMGYCPKPRSSSILESCSQVMGGWIRRWTGGFRVASEVMQVLFWTVVVGKELSGKAKLSIYWSLYVPTFTYVHELWVVTERTVSRPLVHANNICT